MNPAIAQSLPIISLVMVGFLLKKVGVIRPGDGAVMSRFILNITLPAVIFLSVSRANIEPLRLALLSFLGVVVALTLRFLSDRSTKALILEPEVAGVIVLGTTVMNVGAFLFPVVQTVFGAEGVSRLAAFDLGNSLVASSYGYYLATCFGNKTPCGVQNSFKRAFTVPILWASVLGVMMNQVLCAPPARRQRRHPSGKRASGARPRSQTTSITCVSRCRRAAPRPPAAETASSSSRSSVTSTWFSHPRRRG